MNQQCGTSPIVGFRFTLSPMTSEFIPVIKGALKETDLSNVWRHTDDVSTVIRGRAEHVFDVAKAVLSHATRTGAHVSMSGTFSAGCPGDTAGDNLLDVSSEPVNGRAAAQYVSSQFALYPLGDDDYMDIIYEEVDFAKARGVFNDTMHYASGIHGDIEPVFAFYEATFNRVREKTSHVVMTVTFSVNSPSHEGRVDA
ncbi:thiamine-binding protein [Exiguobacterium sp. SH1S21]|uniref:YkoF family thiamine/hydroxymethylpyrimidine-binding protein n=1 Tax=Exiguobacterium sp. SH1S21 TaxID=2510953 RepID=UPI00103DF28B|nr:YkoF family thiamine/hydroxymethylpyrimidine-binding protein [Exiguobacterium sp. SH1S21]TCI54234.1 thiamine-binding protein [Exiguobacterium sp. SH1S21]